MLKTQIKVALAQSRCEKGDWTGNLANADQLMAQAAAANCDIIVFPEMGLSGYCDPSRYPAAVQSLDSPLVQQFIDLTGKHSIAASGGFIETNPAGKPFITQILAVDGELQHVYRKVHVVEEEAEWYSPGSESPIFNLPLGESSLPAALAVCADSDNAALYASFAAKGARVVFHSSAPGLYTRPTTDDDWREGYEWYRGHLGNFLPNYAREHNLHIAVATQTGRTVDEDFPGGSYVFAPDGSTLAAVGDWREDLLIYTINLGD